MRRLIWLIPLILLGLYVVVQRAEADRKNGSHTTLTAGPSAADPATKNTPPAPPLKIAAWVKGKPVDLAEGRGKVFVVEFWATWCPPCRASIPHLTELQQKYKDKGVTFIGVSNEPVDKVRPFVEKMGNQMNYTVAVDDNEQTSQAYMEANGVDSIPHAFVIGKNGVIVWHGHPADNMEQQIDQALQAPTPGK